MTEQLFLLHLFSPLRTENIKSARLLPVVNRKNKEEDRQYSYKKIPIEVYYTYY